jgi:hypothetical protein
VKVEVEWMLADQLEYVIGVDPHRDLHALAVVQARSGQVVYETVVAASKSGYRAALAVAVEHAPGGRVFAVEGSGSYGRGLTRALSAAGERVLEIGRVRRERRHGRGKSDALDAVRAARTVLSGETVAQPRTAGLREALRTLLVAREGAQQASGDGLRQLRALLVTAPAPLREELQGLTPARLLARLAAARPGSRHDREIALTLTALRSLAQRVQQLKREERELRREIDALVRELAPKLLDEDGVGPICAARAILTYSHHGRLHSESAFARISGSAPIPASSGQTIRYRLDRGGDRQLNRALHTIIVSRRRSHQPTIDYIARRTSEGKTTREAVRCLKRYLARHLYRVLAQSPMATLQT